MQSIFLFDIHTFVVIGLIMDDINELVAKKVLEAYANFGNMSLSVEEEIVYKTVPDALKQIDTFNKIQTNYIETIAGSRLFETLQITKSGNIKKSQNYFKSGKSATVLFEDSDHAKQKFVSVSKSFASEGSEGQSSRPDPLKYFFVGQTPLYTALADSKHLGQADVHSQQCEIFSFPKVYWGKKDQSIVYYIGRNNGLPYKVESYQIGHQDDSNRNWTWSVLETKNFNGVEFPARTQNVIFTSQGEKPSEPFTTRTTDVKKFIPNANVDSVSFWPSIDQNATLHDTITKKTHVPSANTEKAQQIKASSVSLVNQPPIDHSSSATLYTTIFLAVGLTLVALGVVLRRR